MKHRRRQDIKQIQIDTQPSIVTQEPFSIPFSELQGLLTRASNPIHCHQKGPKALKPSTVARRTTLDQPKLFQR